jgi:hypothetical protein
MIDTSAPTGHTSTTDQLREWLADSDRELRVLRDAVADLRDTYLHLDPSPYRDGRFGEMVSSPVRVCVYVSQFLLRATEIAVMLRPEKTP